MGEALFNRVGVAQARHCTLPIPTEKKHPKWNGGGRKTGCVHRGVAQARHCNSPKHIPPPPPSEKPNIHVIGEGRGQGVFTVASPSRHGTAANHKPPLPPPPLQRTKHLCNGGGGGVFIVGSFKHQAFNVVYPLLTSP